MPKMLMRLGLAALAALFLIAPAAARETGTPAITMKALIVFEGPGNAYDTLGEIGEAEHLRVERCTYRWCRVRAASARGWVSRDGLSFGTQPTLFGINPDNTAGGPGMICLYEGRDYTGGSVCAESGRVVADLLLFDLDDRFSSIRVEGNVSVTLCRDRDFASYCERINENMPALPGFLDNAVSSYRVY